MSGERLEHRNSALCSKWCRKLGSAFGMLCRKTRKLIMKKEIRTCHTTKKSIEMIHRFRSWHFDVMKAMPLSILGEYPFCSSGNQKFPAVQMTRKAMEARIASHLLIWWYQVLHGPIDRIQGRNQVQVSDTDIRQREANTAGGFGIK